MTAANENTKTSVVRAARPGTVYNKSAYRAAGQCCLDRVWPQCSQLQWEQYKAFICDCYQCMYYQASDACCSVSVSVLQLAGEHTCIHACNAEDWHYSESRHKIVLALYQNLEENSSTAGTNIDAVTQHKQSLTSTHLHPPHQQHHQQQQQHAVHYQLQQYQQRFV